VPRIGGRRNLRNSFTKEGQEGREDESYAKALRGRKKRGI
jgi:hypothetical protein